MNRLQMQDTELIMLVARRDRVAFECLYDRHASKALGLAMRMFGERPVAEEIVQEAFWRVWKRASSFDTRRGDFVTWLLSIVHHLAVDELRRRRGQAPLAEMDGNTEPFVNVADKGQDVAERAWSNLQSAEMRAALMQLPEAQRTVIELAYFEGLTRQEIAERLNEPLGTIHTRARLALSKLKELLASLKVNEP